MDLQKEKACLDIEWKDIIEKNEKEMKRFKKEMSDTLRLNKRQEEIETEQSLTK